MKFNMASYIIIMKKYAINRNISNEDFTRELFAPFVTAGNVKDKNGELLELNKSRVSRLLAQKDDVPIAMRNALPMLNIAERTAEGFVDFLADNIDARRHDDLVADMSKLAGLVSVEREKSNDISRFLTEMFIEAVKINNVAVDNKNTVIWHNGSNSIEIIEGDLFRFAFENRSKTTKNIVVIPVNTAFDTRISKKLETDEVPIVSENTLHGKWLIRWTRSGRTVADLDMRIIESLDRQKKMPISKSKSQNGKTDCYEIETTAVVDVEKTAFYLVAIASFDEWNNAQSSRGEIKKAIIELLRIYDKTGQGYPMFIPLFGTGRSRAGLSYQESFELIKQTLIENKNRIQGHIGIVVASDILKDIIL
ncbi:MAG: macro domain-containing protein [Eubacteriales bacterium]